MINIIKFVLFLCGLKSDFCKYKKPLNSLIRYHEAYVYVKCLDFYVLQGDELHRQHTIKPTAKKC